MCPYTTPVFAYMTSWRSKHHYWRNTIYSGSSKMHMLSVCIAIIRYILYWMSYLYHSCVYTVKAKIKTIPCADEDLVIWWKASQQAKSSHGPGVRSELLISVFWSTWMINPSLKEQLLGNSIICTTLIKCYLLMVKETFTNAFVSNLHTV